MAMKFTFLFLNLGKIQIFVPKSAEGGGSAGLGIIPKKQFFLVLPLSRKSFCQITPSGNAGLSSF